MLFRSAGRWAERYPTQLARIVANPSWELGSSGYSYKSFAQRCPELTELRLDEMTGDVTHGFDVLRPAGGRLVPYFRFPGLCADEQSIARVQPVQVTVVSGDVLSGDTSGASATTIANTVLAKVKPGSIVILNMTKVGAPNTEAALRRIVEGLAAKGLQPVAVSALLAGN